MVKRILGNRLAGLAGVVAISFSAVFVRLAEQTPITAAFFRVAYALPVLGLLTFLLRGGAARPLAARAMAFGAGLALSLDLYLWHQAIEKIGAGLATILANTQVPLVGIAAWLLHRERPHARTFLAIPVLFLGVALISGLGRPDSYGEDPVAGSILGVVTAFTYSTFLLLIRAGNRGASHPVAALFEATVGAAAGTLLIGALDGGLSFRPAWPSHGWLLALGLVCHVLGWILISTALTRLPALETSVMLMLQPMLTMLWASPIFGEWLSPTQWTGALLVLGGVAYLSLRGAVQARPPEGADMPSGEPGALPGRTG